MNFVSHILSSHYDDFELARHGLRRGWASVLLTPRFVTSRHLVALIFNEAQRQPAMVVKVPRQPGDNEGVVRESARLTQLAGLTLGTRDRWPTIVATLEVGDHTVLVETALTGFALDPERVTVDLRAAVQACVDFVQCLPVTRGADENRDWYERSVTMPLEALVALAPLSGESASLVEQTHRVLAPLRTTALPAVFEHADLSHPNLLVRPDGQLQVVDWERATPDGVPGHDLVFCLQYLSESARKAFLRPQQLKAHDEAWGADGWAVPVLQDHLLRQGIDPDLARLLILTTWARSAATLAYRLTSQTVQVSARDQDRVNEAVAQDRDFWLWRHALGEQQL